MPKEYSCYDDLSLVAGLRKRDSILFIGDNACFPYINKFVRTVSFVKKSGELNKLLSSGKQFDRVFIARENILSEELVSKAAQLCKKAVSLKDSGGLICFFSDDDGLRNAFADIVANNYPMADVWLLNSNVGPVVLTDAKGNPGWMD